MNRSTRNESDFPVAAGILFGLGLGGFVDGIILHQVLQWHHMLTSAGYPPDSVQNLQVNTLWDGFFHLSTYIFVLLGLIILWRAAHRTHVRWSGKLLGGTMLILTYGPEGGSDDPRDNNVCSGSDRAAH
jgi:uncharacterized membrane protein